MLAYNVCYFTLSTIISPCSQLLPIAYIQSYINNNKIPPYGAPWDKILSTEASWANVCACMWLLNVKLVKEPCYCMHESWVFSLWTVKGSKVNGRPSAGLPLSPYWESALQSAITFPLAMLLHSSHSKCPLTTSELKSFYIYDFEKTLSLCKSSKCAFRRNKFH